MASRPHHYHVMTGYRGYIPGSNDVYKTLTDARADLKWLVEGYRDAEHPMRGSLKSGWFEDKETGSVYCSIEPCHDPECYKQWFDENGDYLDW